MLLSNVYMCVCVCVCVCAERDWVIEIMEEKETKPHRRTNGQRKRVNLTYVVAI